MSSIAFLDSALPDLQNLCNGIAAGTELIIIDAARDGVAQITEVLGSRSNIKSKNSCHGPCGHDASKRVQF